MIFGVLGRRGVADPRVLPRALDLVEAVDLHLRLGERVFDAVALELVEVAERLEGSVPLAPPGDVVALVGLQVEALFHVTGRFFLSP